MKGHPSNEVKKGNAWPQSNGMKSQMPDSSRIPLLHFFSFPLSKAFQIYRGPDANLQVIFLCRRYNDKSSAKHNLDQFLIDAHKTQIKELNGTTGGILLERTVSSPIFVNMFASLEPLLGKCPHPSVGDEHPDAARDAQHRPAPHPHLQAHPRPLHQAGEEPGPPRRS